MRKEQVENTALLRVICESVADKKGRDVIVIDISGQSSFADYFVNVTAGNTRMLSTLRDEVEKRLAAENALLRHVEGTPSSGWILMDCGDIIVNLFLPEQRDTYQIEKIWSDGIIVDMGE